MTQQGKQVSFLIIVTSIFLLLLALSSCNNKKRQGSLIEKLDLPDTVAQSTTIDKLDPFKHYNDNNALKVDLIDCGFIQGVWTAHKETDNYKTNEKWIFKCVNNSEVEMVSPYFSHFNQRIKANVGSSIVVFKVKNFDFEYELYLKKEGERLVGTLVMTGYRPPKPRETVIEKIQLEKSEYY